jgi:hypothetical protein
LSVCRNAVGFNYQAIYLAGDKGNRILALLDCGD